MKKLFLLSFIFVINCDPVEVLNKIDSNSFIDNKECIGKNGHYSVYKRKVNGGTLYEYYYEGLSAKDIALSMRVIFIPDSGDTSIQASFKQ